jgi:hypothetical protein
MPKIKGREPRVLKGESNPRHYIMIPVGTGNQYCCNCEHIGSHLHLQQDNKYCRIFSHSPIDGKIESLRENPRRGPERCDKCREAEHFIHILRESAIKEGRIEGPPTGSEYSHRSSMMNAQV